MMSPLILTMRPARLTPLLVRSLTAPTRYSIGIVETKLKRRERAVGIKNCSRNIDNLLLAFPYESLIFSKLRYRIVDSPAVQIERRICKASHASICSVECLAGCRSAKCSFWQKRRECDATFESCRRVLSSHGFDAETEVVDKSAGDHLIEYAQHKNLDMIVMGNSIRRVIFRHLLGDTVLNAIRQSDRPLFPAP